MDELDRLFATYKAARLKYLNIRRDAEEALMTAIVAELKALREQNSAQAWAIDAVLRADEPVKRGPGRPPKDAAHAS